MAFPYIDDFNRADGAVGSNWTSLAGTWSVSVNKLNQTQNTTAFLLWAEAPTSGDYYLQAKVTKNTTDQATIGLIGRYSNNAGAVTFYLGAIRNVNAGEDIYQIYRYAGTVTSGSYTLVGSVSAGEFAAGDILRFELNGNSLRLRLWSGTTWTDKLSVTDSTLTSGSMGLRTNAPNGSFDDFEAGPIGARVSGIITSGGSPLSGVTVSLSGSGTGTATTDVNGKYLIQGIQTGTYTVTPSISGYTFSPASRSYTSPSADSLAENYTATPVVYRSIGGQITQSGVGISGVSIAYAGSSSGTATTDSNGNYSIASLANNGNYTLTPSKSGYTFTPTTRNYNPLTSDQTTANFTGLAGTTPPPGGYWSDTFTRVDGSAGPSWTAKSGAWAISGNQLACSTASGTNIILWGLDPNNRNYGPDCYAQAKLYFGSANLTAGVIIKYSETDATRYFFGAVQKNAGTDVYQVIYQDGATATVLASLAEEYTDGTALRLSYSGDTATLLLQVYVAGVWITKVSIVSTQQRLMSGESGFRSSGVCAFDDFEGGVTPGFVNLVCGPILGGVTDTSVNVGFRTSANASVTVEYSTSSALTGSTTTSAVSVTGTTDYTGLVTIAGLTPNTTYYYRINIDGVPKLYSGFPSFKTFVAPGTSGNFSFAFGSCTSISNGDLNDRLLNGIANKSPKFALHLGDIWYADLPTALSNTVSSYRSRARLQFTRGSANVDFANTTRKVPFFWNWNDNEISPNYDLAKSGAVYPNAKQAYLEYVGRVNPSPVTTGELYYTFQYGDVGFFVLDGRSFRSLNSATDDVSKTYLGSVQKQALKSWLTANNSTYKIKVLCNSTCWHDYATASPNDTIGGGFKTERNEIWDYIKAQGITGCIFISGDQHWSSIVRSTRSGVRYHECSASPLNSAGAASTTSNSTDIDYRSALQSASFGLCTINTSVTPATIQFQVFDRDGIQYNGASLSFTAADINAGLAGSSSTNKPFPGAHGNNPFVY